MKKTDKKKKKQEPNYKMLAHAGIIFIGAGVVFMIAVNRGLGIAFIGLGIIWILIGLNKIKGAKKK